MGLQSMNDYPFYRRTSCGFLVIYKFLKSWRLCFVYLLLLNLNSGFLWCCLFTFTFLHGLAAGIRECHKISAQSYLSTSVAYTLFLLIFGCWVIWFVACYTKLFHLLLLTMQYESLSCDVESLTLWWVFCLSIKVTVKYRTVDVRAFFASFSHRVSLFFVLLITLLCFI